MSETLIEILASIEGKDSDEIINERTHRTSDEMKQDVEDYFNSMLIGTRDNYKSRYERGKNSKMNEATYKQREIAVEQFRDYYIEYNMTNLKKDTFESYVLYLIREGYAIETIKPRFRQLTVFISEHYNKIIEEEIRSVDYKKIIYDKVDKHERNDAEGKGARPIKYEEYQKMLEVCDKQRLYILTKLLWQTGLRAREAAHLKFSDVNLDERKISLLTAKQKKEDKIRTLSINIKFKHELKQWKETDRFEIYYAGKSDYVFPTKKSKHVKPQNLTASIKNLAVKAGIQDYNRFAQNGNKRAEITVHSFRKSFALRRLQNDSDGNLRKVQVLLGHSNLDQLKTYLRLDEESMSYNPI